MTSISTPAPSGVVFVSLIFLVMFILDFDFHFSFKRWPLSFVAVVVINPIYFDVATTPFCFLACLDRSSPLNP